MFDTHEVETYLTHLSKNHIFRTNIIPSYVWKGPQFLDAVVSWVKKNEGKGKPFFLEYYTSLNAVDHSVRERLGFILGGRGVIQNRGPARDKGRIRLPLVMAQQLAALPTTKNMTKNIDPILLKLLVESWKIFPTEALVTLETFC